MKRTHSIGDTIDGKRPDVNAGADTGLLAISERNCWPHAGQVSKFPYFGHPNILDPSGNLFLWPAVVFTQPVSGCHWTADSPPHLLSFKKRQLSPQLALFSCLSRAPTDFAGQRTKSCAPFMGTGFGDRQRAQKPILQMSSAYCRIARSEEKRPIPAILLITFRFQLHSSAHSASTSRWARR